MGMSHGDGQVSYKIPFVKIAIIIVNLIELIYNIKLCQGKVN